MELKINTSGQKQDCFKPIEGPFVEDPFTFTADTVNYGRCFFRKRSSPYASDGGYVYIIITARGIDTVSRDFLVKNVTPATLIKVEVTEE